MQKRPPIVVIMGHVDHGKTTLLDYIRKTNIAAKEAGGITQSIGAYEITHPQINADQNADKRGLNISENQRKNQRESAFKITFIDTPGHEAFSKMRSHGAKVADLAILVVAADDGVKPQTKEALAHIMEAKLPYIVAINKIDKPNADIERTKNDLMQAQVLLEGSGGDVSWQAISAKTGEGVNELLDLTLLAAEIQNLTYDPGSETRGVVLMSRLDPRRGMVVGLVVKNGILRQGQWISTPTAKGKVRILEDFLGRVVSALEPSAPALVTGFESSPPVGEEFVAGEVESLIATNLSTNITNKKDKISEIRAQISENSRGAIKVILKADETGSLEALQDLVGKISGEPPLSVIQASIGQIYENDVKLAAASNALIVGFKVMVDKAAANIAKAKRVMILTSSVIYELEKVLKEHVKKAAAKEVRLLEVLAIFGAPKGKERVVGGRVIHGPIRNQEPFEIWQGEKLIGTGKILNLQSQKKDIQEAEAGQEVGLLVESEEPIKVGNRLVFS